MATRIVSTKVLSTETIRQLEDDGMEVVCVEFIQKTIVVPVDEIISLDEVIVLTSKMAVQSLMELVRLKKTDIQKHRIFCLENATWQEAMKNNLTIMGIAPDAASLANVILQDNGIKEVTFICSNIRRDELPDRLKSVGITVNEWIGYRTDLRPVKLEGTFDGVLFFSPSAVESFVTANATNVTCFCIGKTTGESAKQLGFKELYVGESSTEQSLVKAIINYYSNNPAHAAK